MPFVTPDDVHQLQVDLQAEADGLAQALKACIFASTISPDDPMVAQWQLMMDRVQAFLRQSPSWLNTASQMNTGQQLQRDLGPWHARMSAAGCANVPAAPAQPPPPADIFGSVSNILVLLVVMMAMREMR